MDGTYFALLGGQARAEGQRETTGLSVRIERMTSVIDVTGGWNISPVIDQPLVGRVRDAVLAVRRQGCEPILRVRPTFDRIQWDVMDGQFVPNLTFNDNGNIRPHHRLLRCSDAAAAIFDDRVVRPSPLWMHQAIWSTVAAMRCRRP
jgi:hypothetical protein